MRECLNIERHEICRDQEYQWKSEREREREREWGKRKESSIILTRLETSTDRFLRLLFFFDGLFNVVSVMVEDVRLGER